MLHQQCMTYAILWFITKNESGLKWAMVVAWRWLAYPTQLTDGLIRSWIALFVIRIQNGIRWVHLKFKQKMFFFKVLVNRTTTSTVLKSFDCKYLFEMLWGIRIIYTEFLLSRPITAQRSSTNLSWLYATQLSNWQCTVLAFPPVWMKTRIFWSFCQMNNFLSTGNGTMMTFFYRFHFREIFHVGI